MKIVRILMDYDMSVLYHPVKANVVVDGLSTMFMGSVIHMVDDKIELVKEDYRLGSLGVWLKDIPKGGFVVLHNFE